MSKFGVVCFGGMYYITITDKDNIARPQGEGFFDREDAWCAAAYLETSERELAMLQARSFGVHAYNAASGRGELTEPEVCGHHCHPEDCPRCGE